MKNTIFLKPGDWFFGKGQGKVTTILGSCVSVVLWSPKQQVIGVSHIILPERNKSKLVASQNKQDLSGRFADELMQIFKMEMDLFSLKPEQCQASLIGGGEMFPKIKVPVSIGQKNIQVTTALLAALKIPLIQTDTGGSIYRRLQVDIQTGQVKVDRSDINRFELLSA